MSEKKIILVTGATSGIGYETSYALAAASPNNHVLMGSRSLEKGQKALADLQSRNPAGTLALIHLDVTDDSTIAAAVETITTTHGVLDILINNAGIALTTTSTDARSSLLETLNTNAVGAFVLSQSLAPLLKKSTDPRIINVSAGLGSISERSNPNSPSYALPFEAYRISKAALNMATACMQASYAGFGAKVWAFCPGLVVTNLTGEADRGRREAMGGDSAAEAARGVLEIVQGERDGEVGMFVKRGGRWEW
ncbi:hypothetical protein BJY04DRAFT_224467 [Aspergillus karnatakaensis]|uniref:uncharacterized protein n=1 Tax=Aspergillus karnatakaensis TaxID=1810916 RepID=UPI003CCD1595